MLAVLNDKPLLYQKLIFNAIKICLHDPKFGKFFWNFSLNSKFFSTELHYKTLPKFVLIADLCDGDFCFFFGYVFALGNCLTTI